MTLSAPLPSAHAASAAHGAVPGTQAAITSTANPLVAQYSAPPCASGVVVVIFHPVSDPSWSSWQVTNAQPCQPSGETFIVAGMQANTTYVMRTVVLRRFGLQVSGPQTFTTGTLPTTLVFPTVSVPVPPQPGSDPFSGLVIHMRAFTPANVPNPVVTDRAGNVVWYYDASTSGLTSLWPVRLLPGGTVLLFGRKGLTPYGNDDDVVREIDLAGTTLRETDLNAVNAQLTAQGQRPIRGFHHEALRLPNGDTAVLGYTEACVNPDNSLSAPPCATSGGVRDLMGDEIVVLDPTFQNVVWSWDAFAHLDVTRKAVLGETCANSPNPARFCPTDNPNAEDWLHSNGLAYSPTDGNLVLSIRHQDWLVKINFANGSGDGTVIWRLGQGGDFQPNVTDTTNSADPWFSHQHNPTFLDATTLELFDNGNTRCTNTSTTPPTYIAGCNSRGQVWKLDEANHTATLVVNANLGLYSQAQGSAQRLLTGTYTFGAGTLGLPPSSTPPDCGAPPQGCSQAIEVPAVTSDQSAAPQLYVQQLNAVEYRSYRLANLYYGTNLLYFPSLAALLYQRSPQ